MKSININDSDAERIARLAKLNGMSVSEFIEFIMDYADDILDEYGYKHD